MVRVTKNTGLCRLCPSSLEENPTPFRGLDLHPSLFGMEKATKRFRLALSNWDTGPPEDGGNTLSKTLRDVWPEWINNVKNVDYDYETRD